MTMFGRGRLAVEFGAFVTKAGVSSYAGHSQIFFLSKTGHPSFSLPATLAEAVQPSRPS